MGKKGFGNLCDKNFIFLKVGYTLPLGGHDPKWFHMSRTGGPPWPGWMSQFWHQLVQMENYKKPRSSNRVYGWSRPRARRVTWLQDTPCAHACAPVSTHAEVTQSGTPAEGGVVWEQGEGEGWDSHWFSLWVVQGRGVGGLWLDIVGIDEGQTQLTALSSLWVLFFVLSGWSGGWAVTELL